MRPATGRPRCSARIRRRCTDCSLAWIWRLTQVVLVLALQAEVVQAEERCVTVTTGAKSVTYISRAYFCDQQGGGRSETHTFLIGDPWTVPANTTLARCFDVPCSEEKEVVGFQALFHWENTECQTINGYVEVSGTPLGSVTSHLACRKQPPGKGTCNIFTCPAVAGPTIACFTPIDPDACVCTDPNPPILGVDYEQGGVEIETILRSAAEIPTLSRLGLVTLGLLLVAGALLALQRLGRARTSGRS